jgi:tight adherence protein C
MGCVVVVAGLLLFYSTLWLRAMRRRRGLDISAFPGMYDPMRELLKWNRLFERLLPVLYRCRLNLALLEGGACPPERLLRWTAEAIGMAYGGLFVCWLLALISGNLSVGVIGSLVAGCMPALRANDLNRRAERRRQAVLMELPVMLGRLLIMVNAGENVSRALNRCVEARHVQGDHHPLYAELRAALAAMQRGESMNLSLEEFGRRCAVPEAKLFAATLLMNVRRGGDEFVPALRDFTRRMWDQRKAAARTLGEQASSRLAFPLAVIFLLIIVLVGAPTLLMM